MGARVGPDRADRHGLGHSKQTCRMVCMNVSENDEFETLDAIVPQSLLQEQLVGSAVDQGEPTVAAMDQDRIALANIENDDGAIRESRSTSDQ